MANTNINLNNVNSVTYNNNPNIYQIDLLKNNVRRTIWQKIIQPPDLSPYITNECDDQVRYGWGNVQLQNTGAGFTSSQQVLNLLTQNITNNPARDGYGGRIYAQSVGRAGSGQYSWDGIPANPRTGNAIGSSSTGGGSGDSWYTATGRYLGPAQWTVQVADDPYGTKKVSNLIANNLPTGGGDEDDDHWFRRMFVIGSNNTFYWAWYLINYSSRYSAPNGRAGYYIYPNNTGYMPVSHVGMATGAVHVDDYIHSLPMVGFAKVLITADGYGESD